MLYKPFDTISEPGLIFNRWSLAEAGHYLGRTFGQSGRGLAADSESASQSLSDLEIVAQAFEKWDTECFARLVGEWAAVIWRPRDRELILARDYIGVRQLFYRLQPQRITWCSLLAPLLESDGPSSHLRGICGWIPGAQAGCRAYAISGNSIGSPRLLASHQGREYR